MSSPLQKLNTLASYCQTHSSFKFRIALSTFYSIQYSHYIEKAITLIEFLQLTSLCFFLNFTESDFEGKKFIFKTIAYFFKLFNPSYLLEFENSNELVKTAFILVAVSILLKYLLIIYVFSVEYWHKKKIGVLFTLWRIIFKIQGRILCVLLTSFGVRAIIQASIENCFIFGMGKVSIIITCVVLIALEYITSFLIETQFYEVLPTKNFLSSKNNLTQLIILLQKLRLQTLQMTCISNYYRNSLIFSSVNIVLSALNIYHFYTRLPLYNFQALLFQGKLLCLVFSLDISIFIQACLKEASYMGSDVTLALILWIITSLLTMIFFDESLKKMLFNLLTKPAEGVPEVLIHNIIAAEQIEKEIKMPGEKSMRYHITYMLDQVKDIYKSVIFQPKLRMTENNNYDLFQNNNDYDKVHLQYLENLAFKFPKNLLVKLYLAYFCSRSPKLYTKTILIVAELSKNKNSSLYLNSLFLLHKIEKGIMDSYNSNNGKLDLSTYVKSQVCIEELTTDILKQIKLKNQICENILGEISDIGEIFDCGQEIDKLKTQVEKRIDYLLSTIPIFYIKPLLLCADYQLILNYSLDNYEKLLSSYARKKLRLDKFFLDTKLIKENLYQEGNLFVLLSGERITSGKIVYCTKEIEEICGGEKGMYYGTHISSIFTPSLQNHYKELFKTSLENGNQSCINHTLQKNQIFLYHRDKYITEAKFHLQIHPYITKNFYYDMMIRPIPSTKEYILLKENGDIESASKKITSILGINSFSSQTVNIRQLSEELSRANEAFNMINTSKAMIEKKFSFPVESITLKNSSSTIFISQNEALELRLLYTTDGKNLALKPYFKDPNIMKFTRKSYYYNCKLTLLQHDNITLKVIALEKANKGIIEEIKKIETESLTKETKDRATNTNYTREDKQLESLHNGVFMTGEEPSDEDDFEVGDEELSPGAQINTNFPSTTRNLLSSKSKKYERENSPVSKQQSKRNDFFKDAQRLSSKSSNENEFFKFETYNEYKAERSKTCANGSTGASKFSKYKKQEIAFQRGVSSKYYPKAFNCWILLFYAVVLITFVSQIVLFRVSTVTMRDLVLKKNLVKYSQIRLYKMILLSVSAVGTYLNIENLATADLHLKNVSMSVKNMQGHFPEFIYSNRKILENLNSLGEDLKKQLFLKDVRIYGSYHDYKDESVHQMTQFQAVDEIISAANTIFSSQDLFNSQGSHLFKFVAVNTLDDFIYKNYEMVELFMDLVNIEKIYFQETIFLCLIITPFLLLGVALMLILIIWNQYQIEKKYMLAFIKLNPKRVKNIQISLKNFEKNIINEENIGSNESFNWFVNLTTLPKNEEITKAHKRQQTQRVKYTKIRSRYTKYFIELTVFITILIGILIGNYISSNNSKETIYTRQSQHQFAHQLTNSISIAHATFGFLFTFNNTYSINRMEPLEANKVQALEIRYLRENITFALKEKDGSYDPEIEDILISDNECKGLTENSLMYCQRLIDNFDYPTYLLPLLSSYEKIVLNKIEDYENANKTTRAGVLKASQADLDKYLPMFSAIGGKAQLIASIVDNNLTKSISHAEFQRTFFFVVFLVSLSCVSLLIWFHILSKLREVANDFKKVLQVFPSALVLSSFLLKTFLKKSSQEIIHL